MRRSLLLLPLCMAVLNPPAHAAISEIETGRLLAEAELRIKAIYDTNDISLRPFQATWSPDASGSMTLETPFGADGPEIASYDVASGKRKVLVSSENLVVPGTSRRLTIGEFVRSPVGNRLLLRCRRGGDNNKGG